MRKQFITNFKIGMVLAAALGVASMTQANSNRDPVFQEEKPFDQKQALADLRKKIVGQENKPSEEVFKNIQIPLFKKLPARLLLGAMEYLFSKSLGVDCRHCHTVDQWEKDEKATKQIARDMYALMLSTQDNLRKIPNLKTPNVTCYTCHRGQIKPEVELPELKK